MVKIITDFRNKINYVAFLLFFSCAAIMSPPGGVKDEIPPELRSTIPKNRATNYNGNQIELIFSEYIDENSIKDAITILPNLDEKPIIKYKGKKIQISFEDSLENNQTYIVVVNRKLSDERKVKLPQGIQFAFSTGNKIDNGSISGRVYNSKNSSVQLWKIKDKIDSLDFYKRIPDYSIDASDSGQYEFKFLSPGNYRLVALDNSLSGLSIVPKNMLYGLHWESVISLKQKLNQKNINVYLPNEKNSIRMVQAEWIEGSWGCITFSKKIEDYLPLDHIDIFYEDSVKANIQFFQDNKDNKKINFILDRLTKSFVTIEIKEDRHRLLNYFESGKIRIKMDTFVDTTSISLISPQKKEKLKIEEDKIIPIYLSFSSLIDTSNSNSNFSIFQDSIVVEYAVEWINPLSVKVFPKVNWIPDKDYIINIPQESIVPLFGRILKDSVSTISLKTSSYQKYGSLVINTGTDYPDNLKVELKMLGKEGVVLKNNLNSDRLFRLENILEGQYLLMFFQDRNKDNQISSGVITPYQPSEWFYYYPDTINIRSNWELELDEIFVGKNS
ncbi:MAG: Ig-like domain-containing protein [Candidatus Neomarinimicrobiota bacterium]